MQKGRAILALSLSSLILLATMPAAFAFQLNAVISPTRDSAEAIYRSVQVVYIEYPNGGQIKSMLQNVNDELKFSADKNTPGMSELIGKINNALVKERKSPALVEDLKIDYKMVLKGENDKAVLEQSIKVDALITGFVIQPAAYDDPALIDLNWRGFRVMDPIMIQTQEYGLVDINLPSGYLYARQPQLMSMLEKTDATTILNQPLLDYTEFVDLTLDKWHSLFNPISGQQQGAEFGFEEEEGAKAVTIYSAGEGSLREGIYREKTLKVDITIDGVAYTVRSTSPQSSGTMDILGWAKTNIEEGGEEGAYVFSEPPAGGGGQAATGGFPFMVLVVLGGLMAAVAGFVLWRVNKK